MGWTKESLIVCLPSHLIMIAVAFIISVIFKNKSKEQKRLPFYLLSITLIIMEVFKQIKAFREGYSLWAIPLHFCSFFMFWPLFSMFGKGKIKKFGDVATCISSFIIVALMIYSPEQIYGDHVRELYYNGKITHSFLFHELVWLYAFMYVFMNIIEFKLKEIYFIPIIVTVYACCAVPAAYLLNVNYCSILYAEGFPEQIRLNLGQVAYNLGAFTLAIIGMSLIYLLFYFIQKGIKRKKIK